MCIRDRNEDPLQVLKTKSLKTQLNSLYIKVIMLIGKIIQSTLFSSGGGQNTQDMDLSLIHIWFGKDVSMVPVDDNHFSISVDVVVSQQFFGWVFALGKGVKIIGPESVVQQVNQEIKRLVEQYNICLLYTSRCV